jgi:Transcriptional regulators
VPTNEIQTEDGREIGRVLAARPRNRRPDGIIAAADLLAVGIVQSFLAAGISVPHDIAIIGYDNNRMAWDTSIPIST